MASGPVSPPSPAALDPPFRGHIETTYDALLVFEAARRGMIPRVTRRLIERERGMIQSGAVFVFDEHESGIKRWTDGMIWSPSRILGNFLVYRETDKRPSPNPTSSGPAMGTSPNQTSPNSYHQNMGMTMSPPHQMLHLPETPLGQGALRPRSASETGNLNRHRERQLVGSLTSTYKFKEDGLVKKTMSVHVNGFAQHMISYYTLDDVLKGKLRTPSSLPELASLEISPDYLNKTNFRFPPQVEVGMDGIPRYRGEPEETTTHAAAAVANGMAVYAGDQFDYNQPQAMRAEYSSSSRRQSTMPMPIPMSSPVSATYAGPGSAGSGFYDPMSPASQSHMRPGHSIGGARPNSRSARYDPYATASPRSTSAVLQQQQRRTSTGHPHEDRPGSSIGPSGESSAYYQQYDVKPVPGPNGQYHYPDYGYSAPPPAPPPHAWPSSPVPSTGGYSATQYSGWGQGPSRLSATVPRAISISGASGLGDAGPHLPPPSHHADSATGSPPGMQGYSLPPPPGGQEWPSGPNSAGWDHGSNHMHGPGPFQPPPSTSTGQYQAPAPPNEWRDGASIA